jgi:hypothetical protein
MRRSVERAPRGLVHVYRGALDAVAPRTTAKKGFGSGALKVNGEISASRWRQLADEAREYVASQLPQ